MRKHSLFSLTITLIGSLLLLAGCNMPSSTTATPDANQIITEAGLTAAAELTRSAGLNSQPTATSPQTNTLPALPTATVQAPVEPPAATQTPKPTSGPATSGDAASFVADITVPDDTYAAPGDKFVKTWRIKNTGTTTWTPAYSLAWVQGEKMGAPDRIPIPKQVRPNEEVDISVDLTAPAQAGTHQTFFRLQNESGQYFKLDGSGDLWVKIIVGFPYTVTPTSTDVPEPTRTVTATPN